MDNGMQYTKCTGASFMTFTKAECDAQVEAAGGDPTITRTCTKQKHYTGTENLYMPTGELADLGLQTCDKFWAISSNSVGEDEITNFMSYAEITNDEFPQAIITNPTGCSKKAGEKSSDEIVHAMKVRAAEQKAAADLRSPVPVFGDDDVIITTSEDGLVHMEDLMKSAEEVDVPVAAGEQATAKALPRDDLLNISPMQENRVDGTGMAGHAEHGKAWKKKAADDKFVLPLDYEVIDSDNVGDWYVRRLDGIMDNVYQHDVYWEGGAADPNNWGQVEDDDDLRTGGFNVPYHRWTFAPSEMSTWSLTISNYVSVLEDYRYDSDSKLGLAGFAVMPIDYCVSTAANGSTYYTANEIKARCDDTPDDAYLWFDLTATDTATWMVPCNALQNQHYQILLVVEAGFKGRYDLEFRYKDYTVQHYYSPDGLFTRFVGCIMKGQSRDFALTYPSNYAVIDTQLDLNGTQVDVIYMGTEEGKPATPANYIASDTYSPGWAARLSGSTACVVENSVDNQAMSVVDSSAGTWAIRLYRVPESDVQEDLVEFVVNVQLRSNYFAQPTAVALGSIPSCVGDFDAARGDMCYIGDQFTGYVSDTQQIIYQITVPGNQRLEVTVTETTPGKRLSSVVLQYNECPLSEVGSSCLASQQCYLEADPFMTGQYLVSMDDLDVTAGETNWFLMVTARGDNDEFNTDEAPFQVSYVYYPKLPPSPSVLPSPPPCSRFLYFCGEDWDPSPASPMQSVMTVLATSLLAILAL